MKNFALLREDSPFFPIFAEQQGWVPIINIVVPSAVKLESDPETEAYMVDLKKLGEARLDLICQVLSERSGETLHNIRADILQRGGLPLRKSQTAGVTTDCMFWL